MTGKVKRELNRAGAEMLAIITGRSVEALLLDIPYLDVANANEMSKDRRLWSSYRPSLRC